MKSSDVANNFAGKSPSSVDEDILVNPDWHEVKCCLLTRTILLLVISQRWGRIGRMEGGYSSPSIIWIIPLDAIMLAVSRRMPFSPKRIVPWGKKKDCFNRIGENAELSHREERLTLSEILMETIWLAIVFIWGMVAKSSTVSYTWKITSYFNSLMIILNRSQNWNRR